MTWWSEQGLPAVAQDGSIPAADMWDFILAYDHRPLDDFVEHGINSPHKGWRLVTSSVSIGTWRGFEIPDWLFGLFWLTIWLLGISTIRRVMFKHR